MSTANQLRHTFRSQHPETYQFGPFVLDTVQHALLVKGKAVALTPKTYDTLLLLVQNSRRMLSKEELMRALWPDSFVEESNLTQQVSMIRRALGDSASDPRYIVTVPSRGYRFAAEVKNGTEEKLGSESADSTATNAEEIDKVAGPSADIEGPVTSTLLALNPSGQQQGVTARVILRAVVAGLLLLAALGIAKVLHQRRLQTAQPQAKPRSLAILPLRNLRQNPDDDFLGFSLADAVITKLGYVSSVTTRPSAKVEKYRNQVIDIQKVAAELNVDSLLI